MKNQKGVTVLSLVLAIVILSALIGVSFAMLFGGTGKVSEEKLVELVNKNFDLRPGAIIRDLDLRKPIYKQVAAYGHFGRNDLDLPWERTDKAEILRSQVLEK